jgi:ubiquinone/menaquinone biosynthesis C-methylase UbiE
MAALGMESSTDYDAFAPYYDDFSADSNYETWTVHVLELLREHGLRGHALLDLACGSGKSFACFLERGFEVTGCDSSRGMLEAAARRAPDATLVQADLRELPRLGGFDLVTCFDDSLNYLLDEDELGAAFAGVARNLRPGGLTVFDLNSVAAYRTTFASDRVTERAGVVFAWRGLGTADAGPGCAAEAQIDVFAVNPVGAYERVVTRHRQRHFGRDRVLGLLREAGLECQAIHGVLPDASLAEPADETRHLKVLYTARRAEGGDAE